MPLDVEAARRHFPALAATDQIYFDNAYAGILNMQWLVINLTARRGGSQILGSVVDSIRDYLVNNNVQLGASYRVGQASTAKYNEGIKAAADYINCSVDEVGRSLYCNKQRRSDDLIGPSTTQLYRNVASALRPHLPPGSEIICSALDHEANIASWVTLAEDLQLKMIWWKPTTPTSHNPQLTPDSLAPLLTPKTKLVTCTHTSNVLGSITPITDIANLIHSTCPDALLCVDAVAYAPHRKIDVRALDVDIYAFSWYKVYGPHVAQLYVRRAVQDRCLRSLGHYFKEGHTLEDKLGLAAASYELTQSIPEVASYLTQQGWQAIVDYEVQLQEVLLKYLRSRPDKYQICGVPESDASTRVPVVSFLVRSHSSRQVVEKVEARTRFGFRWGHFYSKRLCNDVLGLDDEGVVRVSLVHYNTVQEVEDFVRALDSEYGSGK